MRKNGVKFLTLALAALVATTAFASCGDGGQRKPDNSSDEPTDVNKTQLYVGQEANGYGTAWCEEIAEAFEKWAANKEYEPGKKGVQVKIATKGFTGGPFLNEIESSRVNVFFSEEMYYWDYVSQGVLMDVTEAITTPLSEFGETETIEEKMVKNNGEQLKYSLTGLDGKYYALPWWTGLEGISYDVDLFDEKSLFFKKGGAPSEYTRTGENCDAALDGSFTGWQWTNLSGELSAGRDGKYGTYDDGLPATFEEFYQLCNQMKTQHSITPITCTGQYNYVDMIADAVLNEQEGYDGMRMHVDFTGTATNLVETPAYKADGTIDYEKTTLMPATEISIENGYLLQKQLGKLQTLEFCNQLVDRGFFSDNCFNGNFSHTSMQEYWLKAKYNNKYERSAMIVDGTWWLGQAETVFESMEGTYEGAGKNERRLAYMPMPKATADKIGEKGSAVSQKSAMCAVNGNIKDANIKKVALDFFRFCHTDEALKIFNETTGGVRAFDFEYTPEELEELNYFSRSTYEFNRANQLVYPIGYNDLYLYSQSYFTTGNYGFRANLSFATEVKQTIKTFKTHSDLTVSNYYDGILNYYSKSNWDGLFSSYYD